MKLLCTLHLMHMCTALPWISQRLMSGTPGLGSPPKVAIVTGPALTRDGLGLTTTLQTHPSSIILQLPTTIPSLSTPPSLLFVQRRQHGRLLLRHHAIQAPNRPPIPRRLPPPRPPHKHPPQPPILPQPTPAAASRWLLQLHGLPLRPPHEPNPAPRPSRPPQRPRRSPSTPDLRRRTPRPLPDTHPLPRRIQLGSRLLALREATEPAAPRTNPITLRGAHADEFPKCVPSTTTPAWLLVLLRTRGRSLRPATSRAATTRRSGFRSGNEALDGR